MELNPYAKDGGYLVPPVPTQDYFYPIPNGSGRLKLPKRASIDPTIMSSNSTYTT
jgi:hypothetical protein